MNIISKTSNKHIIMVGFMGAGKSTIGRRLASKLKWDFVDTDLEIERKEEKGISDIFMQDGEGYFRQRESDLFIQLLSNDSEPKVIATGGGIILSEDNRQIMMKHHVILLEASIDEIIKRVKEKEGQRPLLNQGLELKARIKELLKGRKPLYNSVANLTISTDGKAINEIVDEIILYLNQ